MSGDSSSIVTYRDLISSLRSLGLESGIPVIAHASLSAFGEVRGGAEVVLGAIQATVSSFIMPSFTSKPEIIPEVGPGDNAIQYGSGSESNLLAEFFRQDMPADKIMGVIPETLRALHGSSRSNHPLLSFTGVHADNILNVQSLLEPLGPIRLLSEHGGWVLMLGVNHTVNTSLHYAEKMAGRKQFVRWALTMDGIRECPGYPGCSDGFQAIQPRLERFTRRVRIGKALVQAIPLKDLLTTTISLLAEDPQALLCNRIECERCNAVRHAVQTAS